MSQHDYVIDNASGATVRADINSALGAIQSLNSGTSAPSSTAAGMLWLDTTGGAPYALKVRDAGNNHWLTLASVTDPGSDGNLELVPGKINLPSSGGIFESDGSTEILTESSGAVTLKNTTLDSTINFQTGHIIQTLGAIKADTSLMNTTAAIPGLAVDIPVKKTGSKMLIHCTISFGRQSVNSAYPFQIFRDTTQIARPTSPGSNRQEGFDAGRSDTGDYMTFGSFHHLDTHGISAGTTISYTIKMKQRDTNATTINKSYNDGDEVYTNRGVSSLTIMEIAP